MNFERVKAKSVAAYWAGKELGLGKSIYLATVEFPAFYYMITIESLKNHNHLVLTFHYCY